MSVNRCVHVLSRLQRHINAQTARITAGSCRVGLRQHQAASMVCSREVSSNSSTPKPPDTSLFVPLSLSTEAPLEGSVGAELTQTLDKSAYTLFISGIVSSFCHKCCFLRCLFKKYTHIYVLLGDWGKQSQ